MRIKQPCDEREAYLEKIRENYAGFSINEAKVLKSIEVAWPQDRLSCGSTFLLTWSIRKKSSFLLSQQGRKNSPE
jgi:hypothetical protein